MSTKNGLKLLIFLSFLSLLLFLAGFSFALNDLFYPKASSLPALPLATEKVGARERELSIVALGDSLTRGVGDPEGLGYVGRIVQRLKKERQVKVLLTNLAVSGANSSDLVKQLEKQGVRYAISKADFILLTLGGNDLNPGFERLDKVDLKAYTGDVESFLQNAKQAITLIRQANGKAPIYWMGLYNPLEDPLPESNRVVLQWNQRMEELAVQERDLYFVPLFDLFHQQTNRLLYTDHFHPNGDGYEAMALRIDSSLLSTFFTGKGGGS